MTILHIRGNALGLAMIVVTGAIAGVGGLVLHLADAIVMGAVGLALIAMDLLIRLSSRTAPGWLTRREFGGNLFFLPIWVVGLVVIAANIVNTLAH